MIDTAARPCRRWFAFSLRTLFVVVTMICVALGWELYSVRRRTSTLLDIREKGGHFFSEIRLLKKVPAPRIRFWREWLGDIPVAEIRVDDSNPRSDEAVRRLFPEALVYRYSDLYDADGATRPQMLTHP